MTHARRILLLGALIGIATPVLAQEAPRKAPRILEIFQEVLKPGKGAAHEQHETGWPLAFANAKIKSYYVALKSQTGASDVWYVSTYDTYAQMEQDDKDVAAAPGLEAQLARLADRDGDYLANTRTYVAELRDSLSIGTAPDFSKLRGYRITTVRVRIGHGDEYAQLRRLQRDAYRKAGIDPHIGVYAVTSGVNVPTYFVFRGYTSLAEMDGWGALNDRAMAQLTAEERAQMEKLNASAILTRESNIYAIAPKQSYVPAEMAAADPEFWKTNPVVAMQARKAGVLQAGKAKKTP